MTECSFHACLHACVKAFITEYIGVLGHKINWSRIVVPVAPLQHSHIRCANSDRSSARICLWYCENKWMHMQCSFKICSIMDAYSDKLHYEWRRWPNLKEVLVECMMHCSLSAVYSNHILWFNVIMDSVLTVLYKVFYFFEYKTHITKESKYSLKNLSNQSFHWFSSSLINCSEIQAEIVKGFHFTFWRILRIVLHFFFYSWIK